MRGHMSFMSAPEGLFRLLNDLSAAETSPPPTTREGTAANEGV